MRQPLPMHPTPDSAQAARSIGPAAGFTLLELLVAMAVFAIVSAAAYGALSQMLLSRTVLEARYASLAEVQRVLLYIEYDLLQIIARKTKGPHGDVEPALKLVQGKELTLTRTGAESWPVTKANSHLLRLRYQVVEKGVWRLLYPVLDQAQDTQPAGRQLLANIPAFTFTAFDGQSWSQDWPPLNPGRRDFSAQLPKAVRVQLQFEGERALQHTIRLNQFADMGSQ